MADEETLFHPRAASLLDSARTLIQRGQWRRAKPMIEEARQLIAELRADPVGHTR